MAFIPRPAQAEILKFSGGTMGISAVPGSGKTHTLSALAANLVEQLSAEKAPLDNTEIDSEVLIVTFSNPAVANFSARIAGFLAEKNLIPGVGYRVRTLHGMATDIVRGRAEGFGLDPDFIILDESAAETLLRRAVDQWLEKDDGKTFYAYCKEDLADKEKEKILGEKWQNDVANLARNVISQAKDYRLSPEDIGRLLTERAAKDDFLLLRMVQEIYQSYQTQLRAYPALDFADLMFHAYEILETDPEYLALLQERWSVILEDEAQDSSLIQENVLRLLTRRHPNWVRVGDPNQAINETFTTANPQFLKNFLKEADHTVDLSSSGRSTVSILRAANWLIQWTMADHPTADCREALVEPYISATPPNDPQSNPKDEPKRVVFDGTKYSSTDEVRTISEMAAKRALNYLQETLAILVPNNDFGTKFVDELKQYPVEVIEVLKSTRNTRYTAEQIARVIGWLSLPGKNDACVQLLHTIYQEGAEGDFYLSTADAKTAASVLSGTPNMEDFFYPADEAVFEAALTERALPEIVVQTLISYRSLLKKWLDARALRIDQLILLIAQDLYVNPDELSIANQLARISLQMVQADPALTLNGIAEQIRYAAAHSNLFPGLDKVDSQFDPELYRGKIVITTFHKSKGLEWDQVYLTSCNNYEFPAGSGHVEKGYWETIRSQFRYVRDQLDIQAETLEQLRVLTSPNRGEVYREGSGSVQAYNAIVSERLRLLYVGITRAKKGLHVSWNTGRFNNTFEALAVRTLRRKLEGATK